MEQYCATRTCMKASDEEINAIEAINLRMLSFSNTSKEFMQLDRQFHSLLCTLSGCTKTVEILEGLWNKCDSFKSIYYSLEGRVNDTLSEHTRIVQGLRKRDIAATKEAISAHLKDVVNSVGAYVNFS